MAWPLDVAVLGMGEDGHTASFFPGAKTLGEALDPNGTLRCIAVQPPVAPHLRMTLTLPVLLASRHCYLHITGEAKLRVLEQALRPGPVEELPIRAVLHGHGDPVHIYHASRS
jgi:6-phosphogluconolactonase